ncbi:hypothetical protein FRC09_002741 [Ceratobasidium sp. 395]|nr:hypothetical protein FRC09_002741 [Ceratobasidium sp. 395]
MSNNFNHQDAPSTPYYVAKYQGRAVGIKRDENYEATIKLLQKSILKLRSADIQDIFISTTLPEYGDALVQISEDIWPDFVGRVKDVEVTLEGSDTFDYDTTMGNRVASLSPNLRNTQAQVPSDQIAYRVATATTADFSNPISVTIFATPQRILNFDDLYPSTTIGDIKSRIRTEYDIPATLQKIEYLGKPLQDIVTLGQSGVINGSTLELSFNTRQTMIYFRMPPKWQYPSCGPNYRTYPSCQERHNITLSIRLNRTWELAALRQHGGILLEDHIQSILWNIDTVKNSSVLLHDHHLQKQCPYLFWDGVSDQSSQVTLTSSPDELDSLSPGPELLHSMTSVLPDNSAAVPLAQAESYILDVARVCSNIHDDFGDFCRWFTSRMKSTPHCTHVALRFLPQADYQAVAPLSISDNFPIRVDRLIMLYKRLDYTAAPTWDAYCPSYVQGPNVWSNIIGAGPTRAGSDSDLSALEITCMEVF